MRKLPEIRDTSTLLWAALATLAAIVAGVASTLSPLAAVAIVATVTLVAIIRGSAYRALILWLLIACFVPYWVGVTVMGYLPILSLVALLLLILTGPKSVWHLTSVDLLLAMVIALSGVAVTMANSSQGPLLVMVSQWAVPFLLGKVLLSQVPVNQLARVMTGILGAVGGLAVVEGRFDWHPFKDLAFVNNQYVTWSPIQDRGGMGRSEWAFGHSLALGGALGLAIPFILTADIRRRWKFLALICVLGGVISTFSRGAMLCAAFTMVLTVLFSSKVTAGKGFVLLVLLAGCGVAVINALSPVFTAAGFEADSSADYRQNFVTALIGQMAPIGLSPSAQSYNNVILFGGFNSIDNAFLGMGLSFGWVPTGLLAIGLVAVLFRVILRRANIAEVALAGQVPMLLSVAFITQYQMLLFFVAGCAVALARVPGQQFTEEVTVPALNKPAVKLG